MREHVENRDRLFRTIIVLALGLAIAAAVLAKNSAKRDVAAELREEESAVVAVEPGQAPSGESVAPEAAGLPAAPARRPTLVDLGSGKCIPCKMMAPILDGLRTDYQGRMEVVFIDIFENREAGDEYDVRVIPTQIFLDAAGQELFRHEGFFSREDILNKWDELGFNFDETA